MLAPGTTLQQRYVIKHLIGQGGMGAVYLAEDQRLQIPVAIKQLTLQSPELSTAFERKARLLALLDHPALPRVSDHFHESEGQFLVMTYVAGPDLAEQLEQQRHAFSTRQVLACADQLLAALEYLHGGKPPIVHHDIKPGNLKATSGGKIMLLDFDLARGLAGAPAPSAGTEHGYTPHYAALEQIQGAGEDPRSDLYALGATLYHLATGQPPVDALTRGSALLLGQPDPLRSPRELNPQLPGALDDLLRWALEMDPDDRPASASELRQALATMQQTTASAAPPQHARTRSLKRRTAQSRESTAPLRERPSSSGRPTIRLKPSVPQTPRAQQQTTAPLEPVPAPAAQGDGGKLILTILVLLLLFGIGPFLRPAQQPAQQPPHQSAQQPVQQPPGGRWDHVASIAYAPDGRTLVSGSWDYSITIWDVETRSARQRLEVHTNIVHGVTFAPDGRTFATGSRDQTVRLWRTEDGQLLQTLTGHDGAVFEVQFSPDGALLASSSEDNTVRIWQAEDGNLLRTLVGHRGAVSGLSFAPDGSLIATGGADHTVKIWRVNDGSLLRTLEGHTDELSDVSFSPDGSLIASSSQDDTIRLWRVADGTLVHTLTGHSSTVSELELTPDGQRLISSGLDGTIRVWRIEDGTELNKLWTGHYVVPIDLAPDSKLLASGGGSAVISLWDLETGTEVGQLRH